MADHDVTLTIEDVHPDALICSAIMVVSVLDPDASGPYIRLTHTEGMSAIEQVGMLRIAERIAVVGASEDDE